MRYLISIRGAENLNTDEGTRLALDSKGGETIKNLTDEENM